MPLHCIAGNETIGFLRTAAQLSQPFWIGCGFVKPHLPHQFPDTWLDVVPALAEIELAENPYIPNNTVFKNGE
jgi:hypothetical protein